MQHIIQYPGRSLAEATLLNPNEHNHRTLSNSTTNMFFSTKLIYILQNITVNRKNIYKNYYKIIAETCKDYINLYTEVNKSKR